MKLFSFSLLILCLWLGLPSISGAVTPVETEIKDSNTLINLGISQAIEAGHVNNIYFIDKPALKLFYEERGFKPAWVQSNLFSKSRANIILEALEQSWQHGLNPNRYHIDVLRSLKGKTKPAEKFQKDILLSDALVRYGRDLTGMRIKPSLIRQKSRYWRQPMRGIEILQYLSDAPQLKPALDGLAPSGKLYKALQKELIKLLDKRQKTGDVEAQPIALRGLLKPGDTSKTVFTIRKRLGLDPTQAPFGAYVYDDGLAKEVMAFQRSQGLKPDGIIGPHTVKLMNISNEDKINQILVNLERLRWVEPNKPARYVMVNIPSATLWAVENDKVALQMPVVVGRKKRPTKSFTTKITGIRFNPTWTVPPTIKRDDYLPKLREDPYYLSDRGIELMEGDMTVDPGTIDWQEATWSEVNQMRMVQGSGSLNPLGRVRVIMSNPYNIYLHDTPNKGYFNRSARAVSSGCVRMADAQAFADFVLAPNKGWSAQKREQILARGKQREVWASQPLPVYLVYQTVWLGDDGQLVYGRDLYGEDKTLFNVLTKHEHIALPPPAAETKTALNQPVKSAQKGED